jgi:hypothetical protein
MRQTERCLPLWDKLVVQAIRAAENDLKSGSNEYKPRAPAAGTPPKGRSCP